MSWMDYFLKWTDSEASVICREVKNAQHSPVRPGLLLCAAVRQQTCYFSSFCIPLWKATPLKVILIIGARLKYKQWDDTALLQKKAHKVFYTQRQVFPYCWWHRTIEYLNLEGTHKLIESSSSQNNLIHILPKNVGNFQM